MITVDPSFPHIFNDAFFSRNKQLKNKRLLKKIVLFKTPTTF